MQRAGSGATQLASGMQPDGASGYLPPTLRQIVSEAEWAALTAALLVSDIEAQGSAGNAAQASGGCVACGAHRVGLTVTSAPVRMAQPDPLLLLASAVGAPGVAARPAAVVPKPVATGLQPTVRALLDRALEAASGGKPRTFHGRPYEVQFMDAARCAELCDGERFKRFTGDEYKGINGEQSFARFNGAPVSTTFKKTVRPYVAVGTTGGIRGLTRCPAVCVHNPPGRC